MVAPASAPSGIFQKCGALLTFYPYPCCYATAPRIRCRYEYFPCTSHVLCIKDGLLGAKLYFDWSEFATSYTPNKKCFKCQNCIYLLPFWLWWRLRWRGCWRWRRAGRWGRPTPPSWWTAAAAATRTPSGWAAGTRWGATPARGESSTWLKLSSNVYSELLLRSL